MGTDNANDTKLLLNYVTNATSHVILQNTDKKNKDRNNERKDTNAKIQ